MHVCAKDNIQLSDYHIKQSGTDGRVWSTDNFAPKLFGKNVITVSDVHAFHITSYDGTSVYVAQ
jgi:hypothetical protein